MTRKVHMRYIVLVLMSVVVTACGASKPVTPLPPADDKPQVLPMPAKTELEKRQQAACQAVGPTLTQCAIADAKASMTPEKFKDLQIEQTGPKHTAEFIDNCTKSPYSSRQVRVLEVCFAQEPQCEPLIACLDNLNPQPPAK
jgi:hypothetical protein